MDYSSLAKQLISEVGGKENIRNVTHCMTRLRFVLKDDKVPNTKNVKQIPGVLGVTISGGQYQVIIGTEVSKAYDKVCEILGIQEQQTPEEIIDDNEKAGLFNRFFKLISGIIFPVMGVMAAVGIMKGLLAGLTSFNLLSTENGTYQILYAFADGFFYFLPIILGFSAAVKFKSNPYIGATIGAALVYPNIVTLYNEGTNITFMKIPVVLTSYGNSVFPIIAAVALAAYVERRVKKVVPSSVQLFLTPFITLSITVPLTFLVIGPIMTYISDILASSTQAIYGFSPIITGIILGAFWQLVVIFGLHYAFIPILINNIATMGEDPINARENPGGYALQAR